MGDLLSIIVPVYNVSDYLHKCIMSILQQTYTNIEVIVVDDGSTDGSGKTCDEFAAQDSRITVIHQMNAGLSAARNIGLDIAKGKYIGFIDSDDWIEPEMYETLVSLAEKNNADIAQCGVYSDVSPRIPAESERIICLEGKNAVLTAAIEGTISYTVWCNLYRREIWRGLRFLEGYYYEDALAMPEISQRCIRLVKTTRSLYFYNRRQDGIVRRPKTMLHLKSKEKVIEMYEDYFNANSELAELGAYYFLRIIPSYRFQIISNQSICPNVAREHNAKMHRIFVRDFPIARRYYRYKMEPFFKKVYWTAYGICPNLAQFVMSAVKK